MANSDVDGGAAPDLPAGKHGLSERSQGCGVGPAGANGPAGAAGRPTTQDRHAGGDERDPVPAAHRLPPGATCRATAFRRARRSTTSFASSSVMASGRRSGLSCTWPCGNGWAARPAHQRRYSTASRSNRPKKGRQRRQSRLRRWQESEGPQNPRLGRQRRAADAGRRTLRRHPRS